MIAVDGFLDCRVGLRPPRNDKGLPCGSTLLTTGRRPLNGEILRCAQNDNFPLRYERLGPRQKTKGAKAEDSAALRKYRPQITTFWGLRCATRGERALFFEAGVVFYWKKDGSNPRINSGAKFLDSCPFDCAQGRLCAGMTNYFYVQCEIRAVDSFSKGGCFS